MPTNVEISLTKGSGKGYFAISAYIPGQEYEIEIMKGVFCNNDYTVVKGEYECKYTYNE